MLSILQARTPEQRRLEIASDLAKRCSHVFGLCITGFIFLAVVHGEPELVPVFLCFIGAAVANFFANRVMSKRNALLVFHFVNIVGSLSLQMVVGFMPVGLTIAMLSIMVSLNASSSAKVFLLSTTIIFLGVYGMNHLNIVDGIIEKIPQYQLCAVGMLSGLFGVFMSISRSSDLNRLFINHLQTTQAALHEEEKQLGRRVLEISAYNDSIQERTLQLEAQLLRAQERMKELLRKRGYERDLVTAIHHDLREPLRSIVSFTQLIKRSVVTESSPVSITEYLSFAENGGQRMSQMLTDIVSYAQEGNSEELRSVDLNEVLISVKSNLAAQIERTGAVLEFSPLPKIYGYSTQLIQLFQNLITNSIKFSRPGVRASVRIECQWNDEQDPMTFSIQVIDNGIGIEAHRADKVFGLFTKYHDESVNSKAKKIEGSGVGLALCRRIALTHQGELTLQSLVGEGTTFSLTFPVRVVDREACTNDTTLQSTFEPLAGELSSEQISHNKYLNNV